MGLVGRVDVHSGDPPPHDLCPDPAHCDCECKRCKRAYFASGRPRPSDPAQTHALVPTTAWRVTVAKPEDEEAGAYVTPYARPLAEYVIAATRLRALELVEGMYPKEELDRLRFSLEPVTVLREPSP